MSTYDIEDTTLYTSTSDFVPTNPRPAATAGMTSGRKGSKLVAVALACLLAGGAVGAGAVAATQAATADGSPAITLQRGTHETAELVIDQTDTSVVKTPARIYAENAASTVAISTSMTVDYYGFYAMSQAAGSGFILSEDGYVATNYHVVEDAGTIMVTMFDGTTYDAVLVGYDEDNDLAVLKVEASGLVPVVLGDSDTLVVGEPVYTIGNPLGVYSFSMTSGIVSGLDREVELSNGLVMDLIQTDCSINSGNSGGPLFNEYGEVIGVANARTDGLGMGEEIDNIAFAIPINGLVDSIEQIVATGVVSKPFVGVYLADVTEEMLAQGMPAGALISELIPGGTAEEAGLVAGDVVTGINGLNIECADDFSGTVASSQVGDVLALEVWREGEVVSIDVTVGEKSQIAAAAQEYYQGAYEGQDGQGNSWGRSEEGPWGSNGYYWSWGSGSDILDEMLGLFGGLGYGYGYGYGQADPWDLGQFYGNRGDQGPQRGFGGSFR